MRATLRPLRISVGARVARDIAVIGRADISRILADISCWHFQRCAGQSILVTLPNIPNTGTCQLRKGRYSERDRIYHITTGTCDRVPVFSNFRNGRILVRSLQQQQDHGHLESLAFVVMPDHLHWLLQLTGKRTLSSCINFVKSLSAREIRMAQGLDAAVWQRGFHDRAIRREDDLIHVARYIIANPLRAGIVDSVRDYPLWDAKWV